MSNNNIPYHFMPIAAATLCYSTVSFVRSVYLLTKSQPATLLLATSIASFLTYAYSVAAFSAAMMKHEFTSFNPYELLHITQDANETVIKDAYKNAALLHHPDKGGDATLFSKIQLAFQTLTVERLRNNYEQYGHPKGPAPSSYPLFQMTVPEWLWSPPDTVRMQIYAVYVLATVCTLIALYLWKQQQPKKKSSSSSSKNVSTLSSTNTVSIDDIVYLTRQLSPHSSHMDLLMAVLSTPEMIDNATQMYDKIQQLKHERLKESTKKEKESLLDFDDLILNQEGWATDDDDGDDEAMENEKRAAQEELINKATGKIKEKLEGIDEGVLGQEWVERTLAAKGAWPPKHSIVNRTFDYNGKQVKALDHPGLRRNLCMTMGRLHANYLNAHPELLQAGANKLIDQTYFKESMEFRGHMGMLLEAALRVSMALRSYKLVNTVIETVSMFKIGCDSPTKTDEFNKSMMKQYGILPHLSISEQKIETEGESAIGTTDASQLLVRLERPFAENFFKQKVALCQKQGIPPQLALQTYREFWWFLVYVERLDGPTPKEPIQKENGIISKMDAKDIEKFEKDDKQLLTGWPMIIQNVAQKAGTINLQLTAPKEAGKYRYHVAIKSQDFLGADIQFSIDADVKDIKTLGREPKKPKTKPEDKEAASEGEQKKDK